MATANKEPKQRSRWRKLLRGCLWVLLAGVVFSAVEVGVVRFVDPPGTTLMGIRWMEARFGGNDAHEIRYRWRDLERVPVEFLHDVWVSEDARFFRHVGFDWVELKHAVAEAWAEKKAPRGASTITMQCARSTFLWQGRSLVRKGLEAWYTILMELFLPKRRILEIYVNVIEMGDGVYGIEAAAQHYFDMAPEDLSRRQLALLAAILPNPREWDPRSPDESLRWRQDFILKRAAQTPFPAEELE